LLQNTDFEEKSMAKSSKEQIDSDEKKILQELQKNSKDSIDKIAKKCGFSRQKVWRSIQRLEKNKTIWGYHAVVDDEKMGLKRYLILIKRTQKHFSKKQVDIITSREVKQVSSKLGINIECSYFIHGSYDWFFMVTAKDIRLVKKTIEIFNTLLKGFFSEIKVEEVIFPAETNNFTNPNLDQIKEFFVSE
jgi:DNA-binding Lrp family transcriptional regulator